MNYFYNSIFSNLWEVINLDLIALEDIKLPNLFWAVSSVGRASRLHRGGQRFESFTAHQNTKKWGCSSVV